MARKVLFLFRGLYVHTQRSESGRIVRGMVGTSTIYSCSRSPLASPLPGQESLPWPVERTPSVTSQPSSITAIRVDNLVIQGGFVP